MILHFAIFLLGTLILYLGADWLVRGASRFALLHGIRPMAVGLTVVALGTSLPEFVVNFVAVFQHEQALALGNIIGSNISNIGLILGLTALFVPLTVSRQTLLKEYPIMLTAMTAFYILAVDGEIGRADGSLLTIGLVCFIFFLILDARRNPQDAELVDIAEIDRSTREPVSISGWKLALLLIAGMIGLTIGARLMVYAAVLIAEAYGVDRTIIGLTIVAIGTSLPELAASLVALAKKERDISIGNVLGSNLFNVLFVVGFIAVISPLPVDAQSLRVHFPVMMIFGIVLLPMAWMKGRLDRTHGLILLAGFLVYMTYLIRPYL